MPVYAKLPTLKKIVVGSGAANAKAVLKECLPGGQPSCDDASEVSVYIPGTMFAHGTC